jgi:hypothetical protein
MSIAAAHITGAILIKSLRIAACPFAIRSTH